MLDTLAGRVRRAADGAERLVEIRDRLRRQTASGLLNRARDAVDFRGVDRPPLAGAQSVGGASLDGSKKKRRGEPAPAPPMKIQSTHLCDIPNAKWRGLDDNSVLGLAGRPLPGAKTGGKSSDFANRHCALMLAARMTFAHLSISHLIRSANSSGVLAIGSKPSAERRARTSGSATILTISRCKRSTTS